MNKQTLHYPDSILELSPAAMAVFDRNLNCVITNKKWLKLFRIQDPIIGKHFDEVHELEQWKEIHHKVLKGESIQMLDDCSFKKEAEITCLLWEIYPWYRNEQLAGIVSYCTNVTAQKKTIIDLSFSEEKFKAIFDNTTTGIAQVSPDGEFMMVNQAFCEIIGYTKEEVIVKTFMDITHPDVLDIDVSLVNQLLNDEIKTYSLEKRYIKKDRSITWANLTVSLVRNSVGKPLYFISSIYDISKRKLVEEALTESEAKFQAILNQSLFGIAQISLQGRIAQINAKAADILGFSKENIISTSFFDLIHPDDKKEDIDQMNYLLRGDFDSYSSVKKFYDKNNAIFQVKTTTSLVRDPSKIPLYFLVTLLCTSQ